MTTTRTLFLTVSVSLALGSSMGLAQAQTPTRAAPSHATHSVTSATMATPRWAGHRPGKLYLGMSCGDVCTQKQNDLGHSYGVHRQFEGWGSWSRVAQDIRSDHHAGRLPWISVKPPQGAAAGWKAIANGQYDTAIRSLAATLKANDSKPVLFTLHHEPSNDGTEAQGVLWARAYVHMHRLLKSAGALANVADPPILGDWLFNATNRNQDPDNWVTHAVLRAAPFLGIDMYENGTGDTFAQRIPYIKRWMAARGFPHKMVGIAETGATNRAGWDKTAARWMTQSLRWAAHNTDKVGVVSYFNSTANPMPNCYWPLDESAGKIKVFRGFLNNARVVS
jgi:hypothetical protein